MNMPTVYTVSSLLCSGLVNQTIVLSQKKELCSLRPQNNRPEKPRPKFLVHNLSLFSFLLLLMQIVWSVLSQRGPP